MNSLKTLFMAAFLVAGVYGAYLFLNYAPETTTPSEVAGEWNAVLNVDPGMPTSSTSISAAPQWSSATSKGPFASIPSQDSGSAAAPSSTQSSTPPGSTVPPLDPGVRVNSNAALVSPPKSMTTATSSNPVVAAAATDQTSSSISAPPAESLSAVSSAGPGQASPDAALESREDLTSFLQRVSETLAANRLADAHLMLSRRYTDPSVSPVEARTLERLLDQLAGTVIYSSQSVLEAPYEVLTTDTLESIAQRYNVPTGLLVKINRLDPNAPLRPGQQIKAVRGPFEAIVDLGRYELTLLLGGERYAGRFTIGVGPEMQQEGVFMVTDKRDFSAPATNDPASSNGARGTRWIGLGEHTSLHGTNLPVSLGRPVSQGCISLRQRDIEDLYDILSVGSRVTIRR